MSTSVAKAVVRVVYETDEESIVKVGRDFARATGGLINEASTVAEAAVETVVADVVEVVAAVEEAATNATFVMEDLGATVAEVAVESEVAVEKVGKASVAYSQIISQYADQARKATMALSAALTAGAGALFGATLANAQAGDQAAKTARAVGLTVEEYTALAYAADRSGVSQEQLGAGLNAVQARLAAVSTGSAEAAAVFERYGVSVRDANGDLRNAADLLPDIADAIAGMGSEGDRAAARVALLGEAGGQLATLMAGGAAGIEELTEAARLNGAVLSTESAEASEALVDSMTDLRGILGGLVRIITDAVTPGLTDLVRDLGEWLRASEGIARVGLERTAEAIAVAMDALNTPAGKVAGTLVAIAGSAELAKVALATLGKTMGVAIAIPSAPVIAAIAGVTAAIGGSLLIIEDLVTFASGGDSVIRRFFDAFGIGAEMAAIANAQWRIGTGLASALVGVVGELAGGLVYMGGVAMDAGAVLAEMAMTALPPLRMLADLISFVVSNLGGLAKAGLGELGARMGASADALEGGGGGSGSLAALASSGAGMAAQDFGALTSAATSIGAAGGQAAGAQVAVTIGSITGIDPAAAAQAAADEVYRSTHSALSGIMGGRG